MVVHCELYLCNVNRLDISKKFISYGYLSQQNTVIIFPNCQDRIGRVLNPRPSANEHNALPLSYLIIVITFPLLYQKLFVDKNYKYTFFSRGLPTKSSFNWFWKWCLTCTKVVQRLQPSGEWSCHRSDGDTMSCQQ